MRDVDIIVAAALEWFADAARDLPWRAPDRTPWGVLVSEVMLQQTPVARVEPVWRAWQERWPTPADLAAAPTADVLRAWGTLGYPRRALRLARCARAVVDRYGGELPTTEAELRTLPGIGPYTAAAVVAFAHGRRAVVLDTNVRRVLARTLAGEALPSPHLTRAEQGRADAAWPADDARAVAWSAAAMELGALVCTARAPRCAACPVAASCAWRAAGYPPPTTAPRTQAWAGTDRQARGRIMAALRDGIGRLDARGLAAAWPHDDDQRERALAGLLDDGLVVRVGDGVGLPG